MLLYIYINDIILFSMNALTLSIPTPYIRVCDRFGKLYTSTHNRFSTNSQKKTSSYLILLILYYERKD